MDDKSKRRAKRVKINIPVEISILNKKGERFYGEIMDISSGGAFIHCTAPIDFGAEIFVELKIGETRMLHGKIIDNETWISQNAPTTVSGRSIVRWARGTQNKGFGIEFTQLSKEEKEFIEKLILYCEKIAAGE